jgi:membrane-bound serine protease (ClpP class)
MSALDPLITVPFYSFLFLGVGLMFLFLEVFIPSGGILGVLSLGFSAFGIYGLFAQGRIWTALLMIVGTTAVSVIGMRFGLRRLSFAGVLPPEASTSVDTRIEHLVGKSGVTQTELRPAGAAIIDGKKVDVVTQGGFIEANVQVQVIDTSGNRVVVKEIR